MRKKLNQIRRRIRDDDINERKENIRQNIIKLNTQTQQIQTVSENLRNYIQHEDVQEYLKLYTNSKKSTISCLAQQLVQSSYRFLCKDIRNHINALAIRHFIPNHPHMVFSSKFDTINKKNIQVSLCQINHFICESNELNQIDLKKAQNYISILSCFYAKRNSSRICKYQSQNNMADSFHSIIGWLRRIHRSPIYMYLLYNVSFHPLFNAVWTQKENKLKDEQKLILILAQETLNLNQRISFLAIGVVNNILKFQYNYSQTCTRRLMQLYLQTISHIFSQVQAGKPYFQNLTLIDGLNRLQKLFQIIIDRKYFIKIGQLMLQNNTFKLISLINQLQYLPYRSLIYSILDCSIWIISQLQINQKALWFVGNELKDTLILGLGNKFSNQITICSIKSIQSLVCCQSQYFNSKKIKDQFYESGIISILEYLQFNMNQQISSIAIALLSQYEKMQEYQI